MALGAYIAEGILGQEFHDYLLQTMFLPLGMHRTSAHIALADKPELLAMKAKGYLRRKSGFKPGPWSYVPLYPAGSVSGTAEDLARFAMALLPGEGESTPLFVDKRTLEKMLSQSYSLGPGMPGSAHGFLEWGDAQARTLGHGGNTVAFSTQMSIVPGERFAVIILTNAASEMAITYGLTQALLGMREKPVPAVSQNLPEAGVVQGTYVPARRMHNGFLELNAYLNLVEVRAMADNAIRVKFGGRTATLVQTSPYVFERLEDDGGGLDPSFNKVYFQVEGGKVVRMAGDFLPVSGLRTRPWLHASLGLAIASALYFTAAPIAFFIGTIKRRGRKQPRCLNKLTALLVLCGTALLANNAVLIVRMLIDNVRSFAEVKLHILLNYPLAAIAVCLSVALAVSWKKGSASPGQRVFSLATVLILAVLIALLYNWQFFVVLT